MRGVLVFERATSALSLPGASRNERHVLRLVLFAFEVTSRMLKYTATARVFVEAELGYHSFRVRSQR